MMIKRERYLEEIRKVVGKQVIKVLLGMRRVGKSTLLLQIQEELLTQGVEKAVLEESKVACTMLVNTSVLPMKHNSTSPKRKAMTKKAIQM